MIRKPINAAALTVAGTLVGSAALAGAGDYAFEPVNAELKKGDDVTVAVRLTNTTTGKPVSDAVIFRTLVDMAPDGMAEMESSVTPLPPKEPGVYAFKTDLSMAGSIRSPCPPTSRASPRPSMASSLSGPPSEQRALPCERP